MPREKKSLDWKALVDVDLPVVDAITEEIIEQNVKHAWYIRGAVRLGLGKIWSEEDLAAYRIKVNSRPLP